MSLPYILRRDTISKYKYWLVVLTILKNISQWEGLSHIFWKIKKYLKPPARICILGDKKKKRGCLKLPESHMVGHQLSYSE